MTPELWWEISKYLLGGIGAILAVMYKGVDGQIKALWKRVDMLQSEETKRQVDMGILNLQVVTLTSDMSTVKEELKKLNTQTAKLDTILDVLENRKNKKGDTHD